MNTPRISVVVVAYRRLSNLEKILQAWLLQTKDVWLADSSNKFETELPINHVRFSPDPGNKTRHAISLLTDGDFVIKADDDVLPKSGLMKDFLDNWHWNNDDILGIYGRKFNDKKYYGNTKPVRASQIKEMTEVDFVGICTFTSRDNLVFDLQGCGTPIEDLFWQMKAFPSIRKWVIPTKNYEKSPESNDKDCLFHNSKAREIRERFYREYYLKNYSKK